MTKHAISASLTLVLAFAASPASAQAAAPSGTEDAPARVQRSPSAPAVRSPVLPRGYVSVNGAYQVTGTAFANTWSVPYYLEFESVNTSYAIKPAVVVDVGGGVRVWRNLALGVAVSRYHRSDPASVTATVPHPLLYQQPRTFSGTAAGPARTETAVHANVMWLLAASSKIQVGVFGGPSVYTVNQTTISAINFAEAYPYTSLTLASTATRAQTKSRAGFNAGCDLTVLLYKHIGIGALFRYAGASGGRVVPVVSNAPADISQWFKAGGLQVGAGLRLRL